MICLLKVIDPSLLILLTYLIPEGKIRYRRQSYLWHKDPFGLTRSIDSGFFPNAFEPVTTQFLNDVFLIQQVLSKKYSYDERFPGTHCKCLSRLVSKLIMSNLTDLHTISSLSVINEGINLEGSCCSKCYHLKKFTVTSLLKETKSCVNLF